MAHSLRFGDRFNERAQVHSRGTGTCALLRIVGTELIDRVSSAGCGKFSGPPGNFVVSVIGIGIVLTGVSFIAPGYATRSSSHPQTRT
jgi:hypothetical protein